MSLGDGNADLQGLDVAATSIDTNPGCAICPTSAEPLEEAGTAAGPSTAFMANDGVAKVGGEERVFCVMEGGMVSNMNWSEAMLYVYTGMVGLLRQDTP